MHAAVTGLGGHPRLIAWLAAGVLPDQVVVDDAGFQSFLRATYPSLARAQPLLAGKLLNWPRSPWPAATSMAAGPPESDTPASTLPTTGRGAYAEAMAVSSAHCGARAQSGWPWLAGCTDYRSLHQRCGPEFDSIITQDHAATAEADLQTSNVQGVDITRRANQFVAIQTLDLSSGPSPGQLGSMD